MASEDRPASRPVEDSSADRAEQLFEALRADPYRFGFFQALRYIDSVFPDKPRVGTSQKLADDMVRLGQEPSLAFAPSTLSAFRPGEGGRPPRLEVHFLGMFGPNGPLPLHLTEYARRRLKSDRDPTLARFLDVFHHRFLALFYQAWAEAEPVVQHDRPESDRFEDYVGAVFGLGMSSLRNRDAAPDLIKLHFAGHLAGQTRHAQGLRDLLREFFQVPGEIHEFVGQWMELPPEYLLRLGESPNTGRLGLSTTIGARVWDCQQTFRIVLGPVDFSQFQRLLPGGNSLRRLQALVRNYVGDQLGWELNLILKKEDVPPLRLGFVGSLGWTSWLTSRTPDRDVQDLVLTARDLDQDRQGEA